MGRTSMSKTGGHPGLFNRTSWYISTGALKSGPEIWGPNQNGGAWTKVRITNNTPGFRSKKLAELPMNAFHYYETDKRYVQGVAEVWTPSADNFQLDVGHGVYNASYDTQLFTDAMRASVNSQALNKSLRALKGQKVNLGVALGERKRTASLLYSTAGRIGNSLRALKRGNFSGAAKALGLSSTPKQPSTSRSSDFLPGLATARNSENKRRQLSSHSSKLSNDWLALQYGWRPLINDVYGAAEELAQASSNPRKFRVTSSATVTWGNTSSPGQWYDVPYTKGDYGRYTRKYVYIFSYSNEVLTDLSRLGVTNPASVAWEVLPWSFVIDWFIPIGQFIDLWDATLGFQFEKGCVTSFEKWFVELRCNGTVSLPTRTSRVSAYGNHQYVECVRQSLGSFPSPQLPSFNPRLDWQKGVSAVALLRQRLRL